MPAVTGLPTPRVQFHRPAVIRGNSPMTSACGRRGPIRAVAPTLFPDNDECPNCAVLWDEAVAAGKMASRWVVNGKSWWRGGGVFLYAERPRPYRPHAPHDGYRPSEVLVVVRDGY